MVAVTEPCFYPRSPCGERRLSLTWRTGYAGVSIHALLAESDFMPVVSKPRRSEFLSTLSLRRATLCNHTMFMLACYFYPRSPCGERRNFLFWCCAPQNFYPRSPCGERLVKQAHLVGFIAISIHALLAESDSHILRREVLPLQISIHALLAESDYYTPGGCEVCF